MRHDFNQEVPVTTPHERTRALRQAREMLERLARREDIPADVRMQAQGVLRHYPEQWALDMMVQDWQMLAADKTFGLAPEI